MTKSWSSGSACGSVQDALERHLDALAAGAGVSELLAAFSPEERAHLASCDDCGTAVADFHRSRELLREVPSQAAIAAPWFASRVMADIAARERAAAFANPWVFLPRLASRFALLAAAVIFFAGAWLYQKPPQRASKVPAASGAGDSFIDPLPTPRTHDEVLFSLAENKP